MANTYFEQRFRKGDHSDERLSLTAWVGPKEDREQIQLSIGCEHIHLNHKEVNFLIAALKARSQGLVTATGAEDFPSEEFVQQWKEYLNLPNTQEPWQPKYSKQ